LAGGLYALGDASEIECLLHPDDGVGKSGCAVVAIDPVHERAIDLDLVEREVSEVAERREAGAEVVEGEVQPEGLERF
jgi:hypothetical protein